MTRQTLEMICILVAVGIIVFVLGETKDQCVRIGDVMPLVGRDCR